MAALNFTLHVNKILIDNSKLPVFQADYGRNESIKIQYWMNLNNCINETFILSIAPLGKFCHSKLHWGIFHNTVLMSSVILPSRSLLHILLHTTLKSGITFSAMVKEIITETEQRNFHSVLKNPSSSYFKNACWSSHWNIVCCILWWRASGLN